MTYNVEEIRKQFPILNQQVYNKPLIYLDNAATTQKPKVMIDALVDYYSNFNANIHRGVHFLSSHCTQATEDARETVRKFINAKHKHEIIFTRGTTESINLVAQTFARLQLKSGDEIAVTRMEHHSNIIPWQMVCEQYGAKLKVIDIDRYGNIDMQSFTNSLSGRVKLVAFTHVSNTLGTINNVKQLTEMAHSNQIPVLIDGAQAVQHLPVDVQDIDADFYVFSGHKTYAPTGIGVLYGKEEWLEKLPPWQGGGEMIKNVSFEKTTYNELPFKFEAGTPNYIDAIALGKVLEFLSEIGLNAIHEHENELLNYANKAIEQFKNITTIGRAQNKSSVLAFTVDNIHPYDIGTLLDKTGIAIRTGNHCTQPLHDWFGISGTARASFAMYNTKKEIDIFIEKLEMVLSMLQ